MTGLAMGVTPWRTRWTRAGGRAERSENSDLPALPAQSRSQGERGNIRGPSEATYRDGRTGGTPR